MIDAAALERPAIRGRGQESVENQAKMQVKLIDYAQQPLEKLYAAFRTCYSSDTPIEVWEKIKSEKITHEKIREFITERLKTGHASPLEQIVFWFGDRQRLALAVASVRAPSDRHQLRAAEPALREIQAGQARIRAAGFVVARGTRG